MLNCWATCSSWRQSWPANTESKPDIERSTTWAPAPANPSSTYTCISWEEERCIGHRVKNRLAPLSPYCSFLCSPAFSAPWVLVLLLVLLTKRFLRDSVPPCLRGDSWFCIL